MLIGVAPTRCDKKRSRTYSHSNFGNIMYLANKEIRTEIINKCIT